MSARFGWRPFAILVAVQMRGELTLGSSAMTLRDAQQIAHGLIQGYIGPDIESLTCRASTARSRRRFKRLTDKAGTIACPKAKYRDADNRVSRRDLNRPEQPAMIGSKRAGARATRSLAVITKTDILGVVK